MKKKKSSWRFLEFLEITSSSRGLSFLPGTNGVSPGSVALNPLRCEALRKSWLALRHSVGSSRSKRFDFQAKARLDMNPVLSQLSARIASLLRVWAVNHPVLVPQVAQIVSFCHLTRSPNLVR